MNALKKNHRINGIMRAILIVLLIGVMGVTRSYAYHFSAVCSTGQTLYYNIIDETNHFVEITCPSNWNSYWPSYIEKPKGRIVLPEIVTYEGVSYTVTSIGSCTFYGCDEITSVVIPNSISTIGVLNSLEYADVGAFQNCTGLSDISFGNALVSIGDKTFFCCSNLTTISIPETITNIGYKAFHNCGWYNNQPDGILYLSNCCLGYKGPQPIGFLYLADNTQLIADFAFGDCEGLIGTLVIPNSVEHIGRCAFSMYRPEAGWYKPTNFTSLRLGNSVMTIGDYAFWEVPLQGNLWLPDSLVSIGVFSFSGTRFTSIQWGSSIATIGDWAFERIPFLGDLELPNSVISIGYGAFSNCTGFSGDLLIPNSVTTIGGFAFQNCAGFDGNLSLSTSVCSIGESAFVGCNFGGEIVIPASLSYLGESAFKDCGSILNIKYNAQNLIAESSWSDNPPFEDCICRLVIGDGVEQIPSNLFKKCAISGEVVFPGSVLGIGDAAFQDCGGIASITIPESVNSIGGSAFQHCTRLLSLVIPSTIAWVGNNAFAECSSLTSVDFRGTSAGNGAFSDCASLSSVSFTGSLASIGNNAFQNCEALNDITLPVSVQQIGARAFANCTSLQTIYYNSVDCNITGSWLEGCTALKNLTIGNNVQSIPSNSFTDCVGLTNVVLPESLKNIGACAFKGCSGLVSINIPSTVESIGGNAFYGCQNLTSVIIPKSLNDLGAFSFGNCSRLTNIYYQAEHSESGTSPFDGCPSLATLYIDPCVLDIGSEVFRHCQTIHFVVAMGDTPAQLGVDAFADFTDNMVLMVSCGNRVTYYSAWNMIPFNNIIEDCNVYFIESGIVGSGGDIVLSQTEARMGEEVQITVNPNPGKELASLNVCNVNDPTQIIPIIPANEVASTYSFYMPPFGVVVMATFEVGTSVGEINKDIPIAVYPNPVKDKMKIEAEGIKNIGVFNLIGQEIFCGRVNGNEFEFDFSGQGTGIYLIRVETESGVATKRVMVAK